MVRVLASHQCGPGSIPGLSVVFGLSLLLVLVPAPRIFSWYSLFPLSTKTKGAFHSTKNCGMKFRVFHVTNGTVFSGWFEPSRPRSSRTNFRAKIPNKQGNQKMADSLSILLALELLDDYEVEISEELGEDDDITLFSVGSSYMRRNLNRVRDYFESTIPLFFPDEFKGHFRIFALLTKVCRGSGAKVVQKNIQVICRI